MSKEKILLGVTAVVVCAGAGVCFAEPVIEVQPGELNFIAAERERHILKAYRKEVRIMASKKVHKVLSAGLFALSMPEWCWQKRQISYF